MNDVLRNGCFGDPVAANSASVAMPAYIRLPRPGTRCPLTGLSRTALNELILPSAANGYRPPVRSYSLKRPGQIRGIRLISLPDLCRHIEGSANQPSDPHSTQFAPLAGEPRSVTKTGTKTYTPNE